MSDGRRSLPTSLHDLGNLMQVSLETWSALLATSNQAPAEDCAFESHESLLQLLTRCPITDALQSALEAIDELGSDEGRECVLQAAEDQQVDVPAAHQVPTRELIARLWLDGRSDSRLRQVLTRAQIHAQLFSRRRQCSEYVGRAALPAPEKSSAELVSDIRQWCVRNDQHDTISVIAYERDGDWCCEILRGDAKRRVVEARDDGFAPLEYRPGVSDHIRYNPSTGRLSIASRAPQRVRDYRALFGTLIGNGPDFFAGEAVCSLRPLQEKGPEMFEAHQPPGVLRVDVVELLFRHGARSKVRVTGRDCFALLADIGARRDAGELIEAKLAISLAGQTRKARVTLKTPNRIDVKAGVYESMIYRLLDDTGLRGHFDDDHPPMDLWSLRSARMPEPIWRRVLGAEFDRLVTTGVIQPVALDNVTHPQHPNAVAALQVESVGANALIGVSDNLLIPQRALSETDARGYEMDEAALSAEIATALGMSGTPRAVTDGLFHLGVREFAPGIRIAAFFAARRPPQLARHAIEAAADHAIPVLLVPAQCFEDIGLTTIETRAPLGPYDDLTGRIIARLGLEHQVDPSIWATEELLIDPVAGRIWYRGTVLTAVQPDTHAFLFALAVARGKGQLVTKSAISDALSPGRTDDEVAKKAKRRLKQLAAESFKAVGQVLPKEFSTVFFARSGQGYVLRTSTRIIE